MNSLASWSVGCWVCESKVCDVVADGFETIGWVLSVKDKASDAITKVTSFLNDKVGGSAQVVSNLVSDITGYMGLGGPVVGVLDSVGTAFGDIFKGGLLVADDLGDVASGAIKNVTRLVGKLTTNVGQGLKGALTGTLSLIRRSAVGMSDMLQRVIDMDDLAKGFKAMGGIAGVMLGPFGGLLKLFKPLIDMLVRQIMPAVETFFAIIETSMGPFSMTLEIVARNLATAIVPLLKPIMVFLELAAVQLGFMLQKLLKEGAGGVSGGIMGAVMSIGKAVMKLLPVLLPTLLKLVQALLPLIPPLLKIGVALLEKVFVPALLAIAKWMDKSLIPFIDDWMPAVVTVLTDVAKQVEEFWGNFPRYANDFKVLLIDPITGWFTDLWKHVSGLLDGVIGFVKPVASKFKEYVIDPIMTLIQPVVAVVGGLASKIGKLFGGEEEVAVPSDESRTAQEAGLTGLTGEARREALDEYLRTRKGMARGGVATGPVDVVVGEAGKELMLPLKESVVRDVVAPLLPEFKIPALDGLLALAQRVEKRLGGVLVVNDISESGVVGGGGGDSQGLSDLDASVGALGMGAW